MRSRWMNRGGPGRQAGFTLVELLAVIFIIGLLIGILVPAVSSVRVQARSTATKAMLGSTATSLETYKADGRIGGGYPPSVSDRGVSNNARPPTVMSPYTNLPQYAQTRIEITGAGLLVWALAGADLLGTPGFKVFKTSGSNPSTYWGDDTTAAYSAAPNEDQSGAYALYPQGNAREGQPVHARTKPYVDLDKMRVTRWDETKRSFAIETEVKAVGPNAPRRDYPMFLDTFGFPVLYWRADPAGQRMADKFGNQTGPARGIYHWVDNAYLVNPTDADRLTLRAGAGASQLGWTNGANNPPVTGVIDPSGFGFASYIKNPDSQAQNRPRNAESYLLISPGNDGVYGTSDDIANFDHNGR